MSFFDGIGDVTFDGTTLSLSASTTADIVSVNEDYPLRGFTNMTFGLTTTYDSETTSNSYTVGKFVGGQFTLAFEDDSDSYFLTGDILQLLVGVLSISSGPVPTSHLEGTGLFAFHDAHLPANPYGEWGTLYGYLDWFEFDVLDDLADYDWSNPAPWSGTLTETQVHLLPTVIPEPASCLLMLGGAILGLGWRRSGVSREANKGLETPCPEAVQYRSFPALRRLFSEGGMG